MSSLNPEAPDFYPPLPLPAIESGYSAISKCVRTSNTFPISESRQRFSTYHNFNLITDFFCNHLIKDTNMILESEGLTMRLKHNDYESNMDKLIEANDCLLELVNCGIDKEDGIPTNQNSDFIPNEKYSVAKSISSWNIQPVITKVQMGTTTLLAAKNIVRPQLTFKDRVDNSENLWTPKITYKPNNIKPLALTLEYNDDNQPVGYEHPYNVELELYNPPEKLIEPDEELPLLPSPVETTCYTYVDTEEKLNLLIQHLENVKEFSVDVEHHSYRTYQGITCLLQLTTNEGGDFIIDALGLRGHLHKLNQAFTDPKILKVFHGADMDVLWLQRDFGLYIVGLFDTHQAARVLKHSGLSLKFLMNKYCQLDFDKKYQLADWRIRPLPEELVLYARMDTHYLLYIWRRMKAELFEAAGGSNNLLLAVFENSKQICGLTYKKTVVHEDSHMPLYLKSKKIFNSKQMSALKLLYKWRDNEARQQDESTAYVFPNHMILKLAETLPREVQGIHACCSPMPPLVKQNLFTIHGILISCREMPVAPELYQMPASVSAMMSHESTIADFPHDYADFPDFRDDLPTLTNGQHQVTHQDHIILPKINIFVPSDNFQGTKKISALNVHAKKFFPPYERYKKYRQLVQDYEIKEYKIQEAKMTALRKDADGILNILTKNEALRSIKNSTNDAVRVQELTQNTSVSNKSQKDKTNETCVTSNQVNAQEVTSDDKSKKEYQLNFKPYKYDNSTYIRFKDSSSCPVKQPKTKFKNKMRNKRK